jgi:hypothetical protein
MSRSLGEPQLPLSPSLLGCAGMIY